jgi:LuxR family maltose regulon positive regulatory protein
MEPKSLSLAKISKPRLQRVLPRQRLFRQLDQSREYPATWISGPGGSGKTTLISSYIDEHKLPCLWYQIDEGDSDIATFFYYMGLAGKKAAPRKRTSLPLLTPEYALGIPAFTKRYFEKLFDRLKKPGLLVLDNYQEALSDSLFHEIIRDALSVIPDETNVFVLSRAEPPPVLARARASNILNVIGWNELRLQPQEMQDMVRLLGRRTYSKELIDYLYEKTDGWIAGLLLLLKRSEIEDIDPKLFSQFTPKEVFDYFASEIFEDADSEVQQFLLSTSIFPRMTSQMAERLTGVDRAEQILSSMNRNHCFTDRRLDKETTYQYHPLFREFLLRRAKNTYSHLRITELKNEAAKLLEEDGQIEAAISMFHEAGDWQNMTRLILAQAQPLVLQGRYQTLRHWLNSLPEEILTTEPWLLYWLGTCKIPLNPMAGRVIFERALSVFEDRGEIAGIFLAICGVIDSISYSFQSFHLFDQWIIKLTALCEKMTSFPSPEIEARLTFSMLSALTLRQPQNPDFGRWEEQALLYLQSNIDANAKMQLLMPLIIKRIFLGQLREAEVLIDTYRGLTKSQDVTPLTLVNFIDLKAFCYWLNGKFSECSDAVTQALELSAASGVHSMDGFIRAHGAAGALSSGDLASADTFLQSAEANLERAGAWEKGLFYTVATWRVLLKKDLSQAVFYSELALRWAEESGSPQAIAVCNYGRALSLHLSGEHNQAAEHLAHAFARSHEISALQEQFTSHLGRAEFALDLEDETKLIESLSKAMSIGRKQAFVNTYFWRPEVMVKLCCKALQAGIEVEYVQDLIRERNLIPDEPPMHLESWPWAVQVFTLGRFQVLLDGKSFQSRRKAQKRPLEMLKVLVSFGNQSIDKNHLSDLLWPEAEGDRAQQTFDTTLHRLRQLLGYDKAVNLQEGKVNLDPRYCWVDSFAFEHILEQTESSSAKAKKDTALQLFERAVSLYEGHFLGGEADQPWAISYRERLRSKFLRSIERLGDFFEKVGELDRAADCFRRAIEVDDLAEVFYQRLMLCLKRLDRRADALAVYQRCRNTLDATLGIEPTLETQTIYKSLLSK